MGRTDHLRDRAAPTGRVAAMITALLATGPALAGDAAAPWFALHGQTTFVEQATDSFHSPYAGPNSLTPHIGRETLDASLFAGMRLWRGAELWIDPEIDQGFGLDQTVGAAGFPSGEAYKVGQRRPYLRWQRAFIRASVSLGGAPREIAAHALRMPQRTTANRLVFTIGKFSVTDIFDTNRYAHDPRADFLNWSVIDASTFDYAA
ncbi:MAG TPA: carbohydrate porin, partial [Steroidobacteraceae bacterium]|nr:carbohydrate porin [Steroidobacteraceae bacterium]